MPPVDQSTLLHLINWVHHQFGEGNDDLTAAMLATYLDDPELYDRAGWWRCYDSMIAAGRHTL